MSCLHGSGVQMWPAAARDDPGTPGTPARVQAVSSFLGEPSVPCSRMPCAHCVRQPASKVKFQNLLSPTEHLSSHVERWFYNLPQHVISSPYQLSVYLQRQGTCCLLIPAKHSSLSHPLNFSSQGEGSCSSLTIHMQPAPLCLCKEGG